MSASRALLAIQLCLASQVAGIVVFIFLGIGRWDSFLTAIYLYPAAAVMTGGAAVLIGKRLAKLAVWILFGAALLASPFGWATLWVIVSELLDALLHGPSRYLGDLGDVGGYALLLGIAWLPSLLLLAAAGVVLHALRDSPS